MTECVFILGAGGFIGRALCQAFATRGWTVLAATRKAVDFDHPRIINAVAPFSEAAHFSPWLDRCRVVIHAASHTTPSSSAAQPQLDGNLRATLALLEALQEAPKRLVYLSSGGALYEERDVLVGEDTPFRPRSYHGAGKASAEHFIQAWAVQCDGTACILRPSNVYGPGQHPRRGFGIIPTAFECLRTGKTLSIWGDGENVRDYLYINDFLALCERALTTSLVGGVHAFNASSGLGVSLNELLLRIERITGQCVAHAYLPARTIDMRYVIPDNDRARRVFEWSPQVALDEGLAESWRWFMQNYV